MKIEKDGEFVIIQNISTDILDLDKTFNCGQAFRWKRLESDDRFIRYMGYIKNKLTIICHDIINNKLYLKYSEKEADIIEYFNLELDYDNIVNSLELDDFSRKAYEKSKGIRILHQDLWETIITFIISQRNRVERIAKSVELISEAFGKAVYIEIDGNKYKGYSFPTPEEIYRYKEKLYELGLGYRADYIYKLVSDIVNGKNHILDLDSSKDTKYIDIELQKIHGIGPKVSNCILLFAYNKYDAFPIDTWINKVITEQYGGYLDLNRFNNYGGIIQQFWFYYAKYIT